MRTFTIVAAIDADRGIGHLGKLPWRLRGDMDHFRTLTVGTHEPGRQNAIIMGRKTWDSLPERFRPLPDRLNIIVTHRDPEVPAGVIVAHDLEAALAAADRPEVDEVFVIGGASIYEQAITHDACDRLVLTEIGQVFPADARFPALPPSFRLAERSEPVEEDGVTYAFATYVRSG